MARGIELDKDGIYHLRGQVAGVKGYYPLQHEENARELTSIIKHYTSLYFCQSAGLQLLGSHYHNPVRFEAYRELSREELIELAKRFYPGKYRPYLHWGEKEWARFNRRIFSVSEYMRNIQQAFARWFNKRHNRKGPFWAGRFQSTASDNLLQTVYYIELNAVRARLIKRPENWRHSSAWMRKNGQDSWLMPLEELMETKDHVQAEKLYWVGLYWQGTKASKETDALIPVEMAEQMEREQFTRGCYLQRYDCFSRGGMIGSLATITEILNDPKQSTGYRSKRRPVPVGVGNLYALRKPRDTYLRF